MSDVEIKRATLADLDAVVPLFDSYRQFYGQPSDPAGARAFLTERLNRGESAIYLAVDRETGEAAGFTQLYPTFSSISMRNSWIFNDLYVREDRRGSGTGRRLLEAAKRHATETGAKGLSLSTATDNRTAQRLYESFGFRRDTAFYHYDLLT
ncbi:GNAT family N-acetyltransferase [Cohnella caldifontis]|uniref:GNAT family N-acetyltransferase n=1 Tax=Cohnella caldifontis TaxID=3027471 RepID=UPI0023EDFE81|nr:GNAT family N-acetyltransferase [Cohnella sp. YIM B05605]